MLRIFLCGDVMIGRGVDQVMPTSVDPVLFERYAASAKSYVDLAESVHGPIPVPVDADYVWGEALGVIDAFEPHVRLVNLETALTTSDNAWPDKEVLYRAHPSNASILTAARIDCCSLANNHVLDWGDQGLLETLDSLRRAGIATVGAGSNLAEAQAPAVLETPAGRLIVAAFASTTSGTPPEWNAGPERPGVAVTAGWSTAAVDAIGAKLRAIRRDGDVVVASVHWGSNWGYDVSDGQRRLARALIDGAGADIVHGHSSHHPRPIEWYRGRLILYGCGDFITDYEGISGYEAFRGDLALAYLVTVDPGGDQPVGLELVPLQQRRFQLLPPRPADVSWLATTLARINGRFQVSVGIDGAGMIVAEPRL